MHLRHLLTVVAVAVATTATPAPAEAKSQVDIANVQLPDSDDAKANRRRVKVLRSLLRNAAKQADFGDSKEVRIHAKVTQFDVEEQGDVLRVTCTIVGRLEGGPSARSHISFGGHPKKRKQLEKQVLRMVSDGIMVRLAELAKKQARAD